MSDTMWEELMDKVIGSSIKMTIELIFNPIHAPEDLVRMAKENAEVQELIDRILTKGEQNYAITRVMITPGRSENV